MLVTHIKTGLTVTKRHRIDAPYVCFGWRDRAPAAVVAAVGAHPGRQGRTNLGGKTQEADAELEFVHGSAPDLATKPAGEGYVIAAKKHGVVLPFLFPCGPGQNRSGGEVLELKAGDVLLPFTTRKSSVYGQLLSVYYFQGIHFFTSDQAFVSLMAAKMMEFPAYRVKSESAFL